jgi:thiopeptide-type bacteriocin biosynthesis protein
LFVKYYAGYTVCDALLRELAPVLRGVVADGLADRWFFLRYQDPDWHIRLRITGKPEALVGQVLPRLAACMKPLFELGRVWKVQLDTYEREIERYGGAGAIELAERLFCADSEAAIATHEAYVGDEGAELAWRAAILGADRLLGDLGLDVTAKRALYTHMRDEFGREVGMDTEFQRRLGEKYRRVRPDIDGALAADPAGPLAAAVAAFDRRSATLAPIVEGLAQRHARGELATPIPELARSFIHMHCNRMFAAAPRSQELVLYDLLRRYYDGVAARTKRK